MTDKRAVGKRLPTVFEHLESAVDCWTLREEALRLERRAMPRCRICVICATWQNAVDRSDRGRFPGTNPFNMPNYSFDSNLVFPRSFIDVGAGYFFDYEFWAIEVNKTLFIMKTYATPAKSWSQRVGQELSIIFQRESVSEDLSTLESTQEELESGALESMVHSDQEIAIRHQHYMVKRCIRGGSSTEEPQANVNYVERKPA